MRRTTVIVYHGVGDCPPGADPYEHMMPMAAFEWQMDYLARNREVVPLERIVSADLPAGPPAVAITFDDGYRTLLTDALPVLERHGFPAVAFIPTRWIGQRNGWDTFPVGVQPPEVMTRDEILECERRGVEIESHGHVHLHGRRVPVADVGEDLGISRDALAAILGRAPRYVAYAWGEHSPGIRRAAAEAGFEGGFTIGQLAAGPFGRERVAIRTSDGPRAFALKTSGYYPRIDESIVLRAHRKLDLLRFRSRARPTDGPPGG